MGCYFQSNIGSFFNGLGAGFGIGYDRVIYFVYNLF